MLSRKLVKESVLSRKLVKESVLSRKLVKESVLNQALVVCMTHDDDEEKPFALQANKQNKRNVHRQNSNSLENEITNRLA